MASVTVEVHGKRFNIRAKPMDPLREVVAQALTQSKVTKEPSDCKLLYNNKPLDLTTPCRFANLPAGAKLQIVTGDERQLGFQQTAQHKTQPTGQKSAVDPSTFSTGPPVSGTDVSTAGQSSTSSKHLEAQTPGAPVASVEAAPASLQNMPQSSLLVDRVSAAPATALAAANGAGECTSVDPPHADFAATPVTTIDQSASTAPQHLTNVVDPEVYVFTREELEASLAAAAPSTEDEPDDFFEFTKADAHLVMASYARQRANAEKGLETRAMREQHDQQKALRFSNIVIRVHFPDGYILQTTFSSVDPLSAVEERLKQYLDASLATFYLYTTPPKSVLKNKQETLYRLGFAPAANLHLGTTDSSPPPAFLRPEVVEKYHAVPQAYASSRATDTSAGGNGVGRNSEGDRGRAAVGSSTQGKKVPKWLKLK